MWRLASPVGRLALLDLYQGPLCALSAADGSHRYVSVDTGGTLTWIRNVLSSSAPGRSARIYSAILRECRTSTRSLPSIEIVTKKETSFHKKSRSRTSADPRPASRSANSSGFDKTFASAPGGGTSTTFRWGFCGRV